MGAIEREEKFKNELPYIKNQEVRKFAEKVIGLLPDYFYDIPASSTGKYHPSYSLGDGGLYRHTKAAIRIAIELSRMEEWGLTDDELDLVIASLIPHDGWKSGVIQQAFSRGDHPLVASQVLFEHRGELGTISDSQFQTVVDNINSHMGQWNYDYRSKAEILPKPKTRLQKFVHLADYLASRKCIEINFEAELSSK